MKKVFMLSHYDEYGAEDVRITEDKEMIPELIKEMCLLGITEEHKLYDRVLEGVGEAISNLESLGDLDGLDFTEEKGHDLQRGWGGVQLHILELKRRKRRNKC